MKKLMMMMAWTAAAAGLFAAPAKQSLVATAELAPFAEITPTATALGTMMNNPLLPAVTLGGAQQVLVQSYGRLRDDAPICWQLYLAADALKDAKLDDPNAWKNLGSVVMVYPIADDEAALLAKNDGAKKEADGTIRLPVGGTRTEETWAKYTADGTYCAFASTAEAAIRAAKDFSNRKAPPAGRKASYLVRLSLREKGLAVLADVLEQAQGEQQKALKAAGAENPLAAKLAAFADSRTQSQIKLLRSYVGGMLAFGVDDNGISLVGGLRRKPGLPAIEADLGLPAGAFDAMPAGANLFFAGNRLAQQLGSGDDAASFAQSQAFVRELLKDLTAAVVKEAAKNAGLKKYEELIKDVLGAADEVVASLRYPQAGDWDAVALGFDAQQHPALVTDSKAATTADEVAAGLKFMDRLAAAFARQWPNKVFLKKTGETAYAIDWGMLVDLVAAEAGCDKQEDAAKEIAQVKKIAADLLGGLTTELGFSKNGRSRLAAKGVKAPAAAAGAGEARFLAAMPEAAKTRPAAALYCTPYALARDIILPAAAKFADEKAEADQLLAIQTALPAAASKGALAAASWLRKDGSCRFVLRLTGDEVKCIGAAVTALTGGDEAADDDDDDE